MTRGQARMRRNLIDPLLLLAFALGAIVFSDRYAKGEDAPPEISSLPDTPAAKVFVELLGVLNAGDTETMRQFAETRFEPAAMKMTPEKRTTFLSRVRDASDGYDYVFEAPDEGNDEHRFIAVARNRKSGEWEKVGVDVAPEPPHLIREAHRRLTPLGRLAPEVSFTDAAGKPVSLRDLRGEIVVLDFWATWCTPCLASMPEYQRLHEDYSGKGVRVMAVNLWEDKVPTRTDPRAYLASKGIDLPLVFLDDKAAKTMEIRSLPQVSVLDREGRYIYFARGSAPGRSHIPGLRNVIERELANMPSP